MARDIQINGECLVTVQGAMHTEIFTIAELGLSSEQITVRPRFYYRNVTASDFGRFVPPERQWQGADATVVMELIHWDERVLDQCLKESMATIDAFSPGSVGPVGVPMGNGMPLLASGNHYIRLGLSSPVLEKPWRFLACHLMGPPMEVPLGTMPTQLRLEWGVIPYVTMVSGFALSGRATDAPDETPWPGELLSSGAILWDHAALDVPPPPEE